jgi:cytoskeletal protein CcmA (bactofilin family)
LINLKNKSVLTGSLKTPKLGIEVGAIFNGNCNIITKDQFNKYLNEIVPLPAQSRPSAPVAKESKEN